MESDNTPNNLPQVANEDYEGYFMRTRMEYLLSVDWQRVETDFKKELKLHIIPNDLENLITYLREQREVCLDEFRSKGLVSSIWGKCFNRERNCFDEVAFIKKLHLVSDGNIDRQDITDFFRYYCLSRMIDSIMQEALIRKEQKTHSRFNVFINNGDVTFGQTTNENNDGTECCDEDDEEPVKNIIFKARLFDSNDRLKDLMATVAHAINMSEYNDMFGEANAFTIDPKSQNEWYYIMRAIEEAEIATRMTVPLFIDQMIDWYPWLFKFETAEEMATFKRNLAKSISHEKSLWKYGRAKEVTRLKDMWARCQTLGVDSAKVERMYNAAYKGLLQKLMSLKQEIEKEQAGR